MGHAWLALKILRRYLGATGSEVALAIEAQKFLPRRGIDVSVVSMPSMNLFEEQPKNIANQYYTKRCLSKRVTR